MRYTEQQITNAIKKHEAGVKVDYICLSDVSSGAFDSWRSKNAAFEVFGAK